MRDPAALPPDGECDVVEIRTTFCAREQAEACAERLVRERFAACAQVEGPLRSTYRWQGAVEKAEEWRCTCKTAPDRVAACLEAITRGHDYDLPETLVTPSTATAAYAAWVRSSVTA